MIITEWTPSEIKVQVDFSLPLKVSQGDLQYDIMLVIKDRNLFRNPYGEMVEQKSTVLMKPIPRQVPKGVDADELEKNAADTG